MSFPQVFPQVCGKTQWFWTNSPTVCSPLDLFGSDALCWIRSTPSTMSIYTENGYANRKDYLDELREEYGSDMVNTLITVLPASEDFDGLVTALEDAMDSFWTVHWALWNLQGCPRLNKSTNHLTPWTSHLRTIPRFLSMELAFRDISKPPMMNWWKYLANQPDWRVIKLPSNGFFNSPMVLSHPFMIGNCQKLQWVLTGGTLVVSLTVPWILWRIVCLWQSDRWHKGHSGSARVPLGWTGQPNDTPTTWLPTKLSGLSTHHWIGRIEPLLADWL